MTSPVDSIHRIPGIRRSTMDFGRLSGKRHSVYGLLEIDVTMVRENIKILRKTEKISLFAWLVSTICQHLSAYSMVAAYNKGVRKSYRFNHVNASIMIEKVHQGQKIPYVLLIEKADQKSPSEITSEIDEAKKAPTLDPGSNISGTEKLIRKIFFHLPGFLRRAGIKFMLNNPVRAFKMMGNVVITSVGMVGKVHGWFMQQTLHPVSFGIGSVLEKPWIVNGEIIPRQILNVSLNFDHDVIDGAEMARFIKSLVEKIEKG